MLLNWLRRSLTDFTIEIRVKVALTEVDRLLFVDAINIFRHAPVHLKVAQILNLILVLVLHVILLAKVEIARLHIIVDLLGDLLARVDVLDLLQSVNDVILTLLLTDIDVDLKSLRCSISFLLVIVRVGLRVGFILIVKLLIVSLVSVVHIIFVVALVLRHLGVEKRDAVGVVGIILILEVIIIIEVEIIFVDIIFVNIILVLVHVVVLSLLVDRLDLVSNVMGRLVEVLAVLVMVLRRVDERLTLSFAEEAILVVAEIAGAVVIEA